MKKLMIKNIPAPIIEPRLELIPKWIAQFPPKYAPNIRENIGRYLGM